MRGGCYKRAGKHGTTWYYRVDLGRDPSGKRVQRTVSHYPGTRIPFPTRKACQQALDAFKVELRGGGAIDPETTPLAVYLERWQAETAHGRRGSTTYQIAHRVRKRIVPHLGTIPLARLDTLTLSTFYRQERERGQAPGTVRRTHAVLRAALSDAVRWRLLPANPAEGATLPAPRPTKRTVWTRQQARTFLAHTAGTPDHALWCVLLDSLCRLGEALALGWGDVDLAAGTLRVARTATVDADGKRIVGAEAKTAESARTIHLGPETVALLRAHRTAQLERRLGYGGRWQDLDLVFPRPDGGLRHPSVVQRALARACRQAGVPVLTPHELRHTGATLAAAAGVPLKALSERLGHKTIALTANLYSHYDAEADRGVASALRRLFEDAG